MDKQRLAEIMNEIDEGHNDIANMGVSLILTVVENNKLVSTGVVSPIDELLILITSARKLAKDTGEDVDVVLERIGKAIKTGEEMGVFKGED